MSAPPVEEASPPTHASARPARARWRPRGGSPQEQVTQLKRGGQRKTPLSARGEPYVWLTGAGLAVAACMIIGLLSLVLGNGLRTFWPGRLVELTLADGDRVLGETTRDESYKMSQDQLDALPPAARKKIAANTGLSQRRLLRTGNFDLYGDDYRWVPDDLITGESTPAGAWVIERTGWGPAIGFAESLTRDGEVIVNGSAALSRGLPSFHREALSRLRQIHRIEIDEIGAINHQIEQARLATRRAAIVHGEGSAEHQAAAAGAAAVEQELAARYRDAQSRIAALVADNARFRLLVKDIGGRFIPEKPSTAGTPMLLSQVVRAYPANDLSLAGRIGIYLSRWAEFLTSEPREANTEGGVFPAIFGTFMMTVIMSLAVAPFGVIAALYLREYARQGPIVSTVRIAVNNLAGVPSIVFGVFGLGFFCYIVGGRIDTLFYPERLPSPTFGTGGILWASLTLALLTVPVVIVATEEALAAVPRSMREGSYACGASKWQTIRRIVLPRATPGIMTGLILAMARGAGEVAPLMITGVVKLAPELPFDGYFPYIHLERSFMHLGFHIYDVGFQSRNSEAGKPMVFTTTLLLIALIALLNMAAIALRTRLKRRYKAAHF